MTALIAVVLAQALDLLTWLPAIHNIPTGEGNPLMGSEPPYVVAAKLLALPVIVLGLVALRPALRFRWALVFTVVGLVGAVSNVVNGGLV
jgi:hypothetical protein